VVKATGPVTPLKSQSSIQDPLLSLTSSSSFILTRQSGPCYRPTNFQNSLVESGIEPGTSGITAAAITIRMIIISGGGEYK
jgi:hypothetical protein